MVELDTAKVADAIDDAIDDSAAFLGKELKAEQLAAISAFAHGKDTFIALPTGYGKSLIYGILPLVFDRLRGILLNCSPVATSVCLELAFICRVFW